MTDRWMSFEHGVDVDSCCETIEHVADRSVCFEHREDKDVHGAIYKVIDRWVSFERREDKDIHGTTENVIERTMNCER